MLIGLMRSLSDLNGEEKASAGKNLNSVKQQINQLLSDKKIGLLGYGDLKDAFDLSMPGKASSIGSIHPITKIMNNAIEIFESLKFECVEGPEIEDEFP